MDRLGVVKARKQELEQVFADRRDGALRREVRSVDVIHPAAGGVGIQDGFGNLAEVFVHEP